MPQLAIYLDHQTYKKMDRAVRASHASRSAWVREAIEDKINSGITEDWFKLWGTWEDKRPVRKILKDIKSTTPQKERQPLK